MLTFVQSLAGSTGVGGQAAIADKMSAKTRRAYSPVLENPQEAWRLGTEQGVDRI
jgi:hypothetical protein